ncbi:MAG: PAS domain-containing protein [Patescibacteria group bacterium]
MDASNNVFFGRFWEEGWTYIKTVVDVVREPVLILDKDLRVIAANEPFYQTFRVSATDTEGRVIYKLGNGQWDIPALRKLLEDVLPQHTFFRGFEVTHEFPLVGRKIIILNARQIHFKADTPTKHLPPIILLAMEDVTEMMDVAEMLSRHTKEFETKITARTGELGSQVKELEKEIKKLKNNRKNK